MEQNQVYELFEGLLKDIVLHRPDQPLDYLIQKLQKPKGKYSPVIEYPSINV